MKTVSVPFADFAKDNPIGAARFPIFPDKMDSDLTLNEELVSGVGFDIQKRKVIIE